MIPAWVLIGEVYDVERALGPIERAGLSRLVALPDGAVCAELSSAPTAATRERVERRLGRPVEERASCDVAFAALGRGYVLVLVEPPADGLEDTVDAVAPAFREVSLPLDSTTPRRVCFPRGAVVDPLDVTRALQQAGMLVLGTWEVGACRR